MATRSALFDAVRRARMFVFPVDCAGCGLPDERLCCACARALEAQPRPVRLGTGARAGAAAGAATGAAAGNGGGSRIGGGPSDFVIVSAGEYTAPMARVLHAFKEEGRTGLARDLAPRLSSALDAFTRTVGRDGSARIGVRLVAPPSSRENRRARGFEPLELIAHHAGTTLWQPLVSARRREDQASLSVEARADNMRHSLRARGDVAGASIVLIDDLMTTGATLTEMARALHEAGASVCGAVVLAHAVRRWPASQHAEL